MSKKINTYEPTDVNYHGGMKYGANIHAISVQVNQYVWDMIKILNSNNLYGFNFQAKIGTKKTIVVMKHKDKELLEKARKLLKDSHDSTDFVFLTKLTKKRSNKVLWLVVAMLLIFALIGRFLWFLYEEKLISFPSFTSSVSKEVSTKTTPVIKDIEIDIEKLKAFQESFPEENATIDETTMKVMEITTGVVSSFVSEKEKAKYSSKNLVENFKGKSGIRFVAKDGNLSKDFNATVKELNHYAQNFINDSNVSLALQCFDKVLESNTSSEEEEVLETLARQGELYENIGQEEKAKESYSKILEHNSTVNKNENERKDELVKHGLTTAVTYSKLAKIYEDLNQTALAKETIITAETVYKQLLVEFRKRSKERTIEDSELAWALNYFANFYADDKKEYLLSIEIRKEALAIYKRRVEEKPKEFALLYYKTLNSLGKSYLMRAKISLARKTYTDALEVVRNILKEDVYKALSFRALAMVEIKNKRFVKANNYCNDALKIYKKLVQKNPKRYASTLVEMHGCFAYLEKEKGNYILAEKRYKEVVLSYKQMNTKTPLKYNLEIADVLNKLAFIEIVNLNKLMEGEIKLFESVSLAKKVKKIETKRAKKILSKSYRSLAYLAIMEKNMQAGADYYKQAYALKKF